MKKVLCLGAGGFICSHMATKLKNDGYYVVGADLKPPDFSKTDCDEFYQGDLRNTEFVNNLFIYHNYYDFVLQMAADMGGALWVFTGEHDADILHNSAMINLNVAKAASNRVGKIFYSSSACVYPEQIQSEPDNKGLKEHEAYPINCDSDYGYEKIFSERVYDAFRRNYGLDIRIARFHNIFGVNGTYKGGREKYPAAICRKVAEAKDSDTITIWGDGLQTRSFLNVNECLKCVDLLMKSNVTEPLNIGSDEMISVNDMAKMVIEISGKDLKIEHDLTKPQGVRGRNSDNTLIKEKLGYAPKQDLKAEMTKLYNWVNSQII